MDYIGLVQEAVLKSGAREDLPTTVAGATGMLRLFVNWVADAWRGIQLESEDWWFRQLRDQTIALSSGTDEYSLSSQLATINTRTVTLYKQGQGVDELPLGFVDYDDWRMVYDTKVYENARPKCYTITPDNKIAVFPVPDVTYTLRFDAVRAIETLATDTNVPTGLPADYHLMIVWAAVMKYAKHYEDGTKYIEAEEEYKKYQKRAEARQAPRIRIRADQLRRGL
jgi:hypothetical protein